MEDPFFDGSCAFESNSIFVAATFAELKDQQVLVLAGHVPVVAIKREEETFGCLPYVNTMRKPEL